MAEEREGIITIERTFEGRSSQGNPYLGLRDKNDKSYFIWDTNLIEEAKRTIEEGSKVLITYKERGDKPAIITKFQVVGKEEVRKEPKITKDEKITRVTALKLAVNLVSQDTGGSFTEKIEVVGQVYEAFLEAIRTGKSTPIMKVVRRRREEWS